MTEKILIINGAIITKIELINPTEIANCWESTEVINQPDNLGVLTPTKKPIMANPLKITTKFA